MRQTTNIYSQKAPKWKRVVFVVFLVVLLPLAPIQTREAHAWDALAANIAKQFMEEIQRIIRGMMLNLLKQAAIKSINQQMNSIVAGDSSSGALYISDWEDYLVKKPTESATNYLNDNLSQITSGKGFTSSYKSEGFSEGQQSYYGKLVETAKEMNNESILPEVTYVGNPKNMMTEGDPSYNFNSFLSGVNNPWSLNAYAKTVYNKKKQEEQLQAANKAVAYQGFIGTGEKNGKGAITSPGILTKESMATAQGMGMMSITSATNPEEVVVAVVSQMISKMLSQGIGNAKRAVQKEANDVTNKVTSEMNKAIKNSGPGALYNSF